jgi:hypothetical protein
MGRPKGSANQPRQQVAVIDPPTDGSFEIQTHIRHARELAIRAGFNPPSHASADEIYETLSQRGIPEDQEQEIKWEHGASGVKAIDRDGWWSMEITMDGNWSYTRYAPTNLHNRPHNPRSPQDATISGRDLDGFLDTLIQFRDYADDAMDQMALSLREQKDASDAVIAEDSEINEFGPKDQDPQELFIISECLRLGGGVRNLAGALVFMASAYGIAIKNDPDEESPILDPQVPGLTTSLIEPNRNIMAIKADVLKAIEKNPLS